MMMGAGMMMGRGRRMCRPGCMNSCCRRVVICSPGCMGPCCVSRTMCAPGCTLPCCMNQQVITRTYQYAPPPPGVTNTNPYAPNHFFVSSQPQQMQPMQPIQKIQQPTLINNDSNLQNDMERQLLQRQATLNEEKKRQKQMAEKLRIDKE